MSVFIRLYERYHLTDIYDDVPYAQHHQQQHKWCVGCAPSANSIARVLCFLLNRHHDAAVEGEVYRNRMQLPGVFGCRLVRPFVHAAVSYVSGFGAQVLRLVRKMKLKEK